MASVAVPRHGLADVVHQLKQHKPTSNAPGEHPQDPPLAQPEQRPSEHVASPMHSPRESVSEMGAFGRDSYSRHPRKSSTSGYRHPPPGTPSGRTGPPRSISYSYNYSISGHNTSRHNSEHEDPGSSHMSHEDHRPVDLLDSPDFRPIQSPFRGVLDYDAERKEKEKEEASEDRKGKRRERDSYFPETWMPFRWGESPKVEHAPFKGSSDNEEEPPADRGLTDSPVPEEEEEGPKTAGVVPSRKASMPTFRKPRRARSLPHLKEDPKQETKTSPTPKWSRLKSLIPHIAGQRAAAGTPGPSAVIPQSVNITDELIAGGLSTLMLRLWFERDEKGHRRVPVLFHRLRIRVSDSLHPLHGHRAVFRIEFEYANGASRWVVYRQLREFISLHTHYTISNAYNRNVESLPDFPKTSEYQRCSTHLERQLTFCLQGLPYFKWLKERGDDVGKADFARMQREALENYLLELIRSVVSSCFNDLHICLFNNS